MSIEFTESGLAVQPLAEITEELAEGYRSIYGQDISVEPESPDGQRIGIEAKARADMQAFALMLYNQQDPDFATGQVLRSKMKYAGITIRPATRSQVDIEVFSSRVFTLPAGFTIIDELGQEWETNAPEPILSAGITLITFFAKEFGAVQALPNTVNQVVTVELGINSVNNPDAAIPGVDEETDEQARARRRRSVQLPALTPLGAIISRIANITSVTDVIGYENDTDVYDPVRDIARHTFWLIVEGGSITEIAEAMATAKTGGAGTKGAVEGIYIEAVPRPTGGSFLVTHRMKFDRPEPIPIWVDFYVKRKNPDQPVPISVIIQKFTERNYATGDLVVASELYETAYEAGSTFIVYDLRVSLDGTTWTDEEISPGLAGKPFVDPANVTFNEIA